MNDAALLARCRDLRAAIAPGVWTRVHDADGAMIEAAGEMRGERIVVARFTPHASEAEIEFAVEAPRMVGFLLSLVDRAIAAARAGNGQSAVGNREDDRLPTADPRLPPPKDYAAQAAMACAKPAFKRFLMERHGLSFDGAQDEAARDARATQKLRGILGVTSRRELNDGGQAAERWRALWREFEGWRKAG